MPYARIQLDPGIVRDDTHIVARPRWVAGDKVRFYRKLPQPIGGWELASVDMFVGIARAILGWNANDGRAFGAVGTSQRLYGLYGGRLYNITPIRSTATLGSNPIATTSTSTTVTITHSSHGAATGDTVYIFGATVNGCTVGGLSSTLSGPFSTSAGLKFVTVAHTAHGLAKGDIVNFSGASASGGITISGDYTVYVLDANNYQIEHSAAATSTATGGGTVTYKYFKASTLTYVDANSYTVTGSGAANASSSGGGSNVAVKYEISIGLENGLGGGGFGLGAFGGGGFGTGSFGQSNTLRTWSLCQWGQYLNCAPRYGGAYEWQLNTSQRAALITNAPTQVGTLFVTPQYQLVAVGATVSGTYDPLRIAWTDIQDNTLWAADVTNQAGSFNLGLGSEAIVGRPSAGQNLIWTDKALYRMQYNGDPGLVYSFGDPLGTDCGIAGPNAVSEQDGRAFWVGTTKQFHFYDGSAPRVVDCPSRNYFFDNLSPAQDDKIFIWPNNKFNELWILYPVGTSQLECSNYMTWNWITGEFTDGTFARSAGMDEGALGNPIMADTSGNLWFHETGTSNSGAAFDAYIESSPFEISDGNELMDIWQWVPDFQSLVVGVRMYLYTADKPQGTEILEGPFTATPTTEDVDMRVGGVRQARIRLESISDANTFWRGGDIRFELQPAGTRN